MKIHIDSQIAHPSQVDNHRLPIPNCPRSGKLKALKRAADSSPGQASLRAPPWVIHPEIKPLTAKPRDSANLICGTPFAPSVGWFTEIPSTLRHRKEDGFVATVLFISLLAIMLMLATAGGMAIINLHNEVKAVQRQQIKRLDLSVTNSVAISHLNITKVALK